MSKVKKAAVETEKKPEVVKVVKPEVVKPEVVKPEVVKVVKPEVKPTKKAIVLKSLEGKGATVAQMAQKIVDLGIDPDYDKNCRVVKAWLHKMKRKALPADRKPVA